MKDRFGFDVNDRLIWFCVTLLKCALFFYQSEYDSTLADYCLLIVLRCCRASAHANNDTLTLMGMAQASKWWNTILTPIVAIIIIREVA